MIKRERMEVKEADFQMGSWHFCSTALGEDLTISRCCLRYRAWTLFQPELFKQHVATTSRCYRGTLQGLQKRMSLVKQKFLAIASRELCKACITIPKCQKEI